MNQTFGSLWQIFLRRAYKKFVHPYILSGGLTAVCFDFASVTENPEIFQFPKLISANFQPLFS